jgi:hypothetical protein
MPLFQSFVQAGFECATHRNIHKKRIDVAASSRHLEFLRQDYERLLAIGIRTVREGVRWHVVEPAPGVYNLASAESLYEAAACAGIEIVLDLMHFGWPDFIDIFSHDFVPAFRKMAARVARMLKRRGLERPFIIPINEISFLSWAGGDAGAINPHASGRGPELKLQLARAAIGACEIFREELPGTRLLSAEPAIHIFGREDVPGDALDAERCRLAMFEAWDMLLGRALPELGGRAEYIDVIGVNYYDRNQWVHHGGTVWRGDRQYRPFHSILQEVWHRYAKPLWISETGTENDERAPWLDYIAAETAIALRQGVPLEGICLYPIVNHPGWDDDRHCCNGLYDYAEKRGHREMHTPLAEAIARAQARFEHAPAAERIA